MKNGPPAIIFFFCVKGKIPSYLGSSFSFIAPVLMVVKLSGINSALGGIIAAGLIYAIVALIVIIVGYKWIDEMVKGVNVDENDIYKSILWM